jgi:hypothetical protein
MEEADYEYLVKTVGKDFNVKKKRTFLNRGAHESMPEKVESGFVLQTQRPLPLDFPPERHAQPKISETLEEGVILYKPGFEFLESPEDWTVIEGDVTLDPTAILYSCEGTLFVGRGLLDEKYFKELRNIAQRKFNNLRFEEPVGLFSPEEGDPVLYHTYSGGLTLDKIGRLSASAKQKTIKLLAKAMRELHRNRIVYQQTIPTNIRYDLREKMFFNPHNCINAGDDDDIGNLLYTHDYITDGKEFLRHYFGKSKRVRSQDFETYRQYLIHYMDDWCLAKGGTELLGMWERRGNIGQQKLG